MKNHAEYGFNIIKRIKLNMGDGDLLNQAKIFALTHHEKWDGTGYPRGLKGKRIPLQGRIMSIVDVYDALTSVRPQRDRKSHNEAVDAIKSGSGTHFDPELVEIFIECEGEFEKVC
jgi:putative two-component system response regulator